MSNTFIYWMLCHWIAMEIKWNEYTLKIIMIAHLVYMLQLLNDNVWFVFLILAPQKGNENENFGAESSGNKTQTVILCLVK